MAKPWKTLERVDTDEGVLELRQRDAKDFLITLGGLVLMNSMANRSEVVLGHLGCRNLASHPQPRVLVGGLGKAVVVLAERLDHRPILGVVHVEAQKGGLELFVDLF